MKRDIPKHSLIRERNNSFFLDYSIQSIPNNTLLVIVKIDNTKYKETGCYYWKS